MMKRVLLHYLLWGNLISYQFSSKLISPGIWFTQLKGLLDTGDKFEYHFIANALCE
jgi:hypothetical protein